MAQHQTRMQIAESADVLDTPHLPNHIAHTVNRSFELPKGLYLSTVALFLGFIGVLGFGFSTPGLIIPLAICAIIVIAGFKVPALWAQMHPASRQSQMGWGQFQARGIRTYTGTVTARDATVQVLILPVLIFLWGVVFVAIAAIA